jgi:hypothetical protein
MDFRATDGGMNNIKGNTKWLFIFKISVRISFVAYGLKSKTILASREERSLTIVRWKICKWPESLSLKKNVSKSSASSRI